MSSTRIYYKVHSEICIKIRHMRNFVKSIDREWRGCITSANRKGAAINAIRVSGAERYGGDGSWAI